MKYSCAAEVVLPGPLAGGAAVVPPDELPLEEPEELPELLPLDEDPDDDPDDELPDDDPELLLDVAPFIPPELAP